MLVVFILMGILVFVLSKLGLFTINKIDIVTQNISCIDGNQLKTSSGLLGQNLFSSNFKDVAKNLKEKFICIKDIELSLVFPNKVRIETKDRQPVALLLLLKSKEASASSLLENIATPSAEQSQEAYLIDDEGIAFAKDIGITILPKIFLYNTSVSLGKKAASDNIENSLKILVGVKKLGLDVKMAAILDNFFVLFSYPRVVFKLDDKMNKFFPAEIDTQLASLQLILDKAKIDLKELEFIDLRFDKPIVRIAPKK